MPSKSEIRKKNRLDREFTLKAMIDEGLSQSDIARKMGISRQRVNQMLRHREDLARKKVYYHVKKGNIIKPSCCESCGAAAGLEAHHEDHLLELEVDWLCKKCHMARHCG